MQTRHVASVNSLLGDLPCFMDSKEFGTAAMRLKLPALQAEEIFAQLVSHNVVGKEAFVRSMLQFGIGGTRDFILKP